MSAFFQRFWSTVRALRVNEVKLTSRNAFIKDKLDWPPMWNLYSIFWTLLMWCLRQNFVKCRAFFCPFFVAPPVILQLLSNIFGKLKVLRWYIYHVNFINIAFLFPKFWTFESFTVVKIIILEEFFCRDLSFPEALIFIRGSPLHQAMCPHQCLSIQIIFLGVMPELKRV